MNKVNASLLITLIIGATYIMYMNQDSQKSSETLFGEWKGEHGLMLNLSPEEQIYRLSVFKQNLNGSSCVVRKIQWRQISEYISCIYI